MRAFQRTLATLLADPRSSVIRRLRTSIYLSTTARGSRGLDEVDGIDWSPVTIGIGASGGSECSIWGTYYRHQKAAGRGCAPIADLFTHISPGQVTKARVRQRPGRAIARLGWSMGRGA